MNIDTLYTAKSVRRAAAQIIRHCKTHGFDPDTGIGTAWLRDEQLYENAGAMLAKRGFGTIKPATTAGRGNTFTLRNY